MICSGDYRGIVSALWLCPQRTAFSLRCGEYHSAVDTVTQHGLLPAAGREDVTFCVRLCTAKLGILCICCKTGQAGAF